MRTAMAPVKLVPVMVNTVPGPPVVGVKLVMVGTAAAEKSVTAAPFNVRAVAHVRLVPVRVTVVPTAPLVDVKLVMLGAGVTTPAAGANADPRNAALAPLTAVGKAMDCTSMPPGVYSSKKTAVADPLSAAAPSPTRATTTLPGAKGSGRSPRRPQQEQHRQASQQTYCAEVFQEKNGENENKIKNDNSMGSAQSKSIGRVRHVMES